MLVSMGRPRRHDEHTADALLEAAERIVERQGSDALTVRALADAIGTSTRAVYSVFGSKDVLLVALGARAFDLLRTQVAALPTTSDPTADLVEAGAGVFRRFAIDHPALFAIGVQRELPDPTLATGFLGAARDALAELEARIKPLEAAGLLGNRSIRDAARSFHALCEGLTAMELRSLLPAGDEKRIWRDALTTLVRGFSLPLSRRQTPRKTATS
jgi:AcrR family transcriptional regulator